MVPSHIAAAADSTVSGSATNTPQPADSEYIVPVTVGASTVNLDFDTGSADLWVYTSSTAGGAGHNYYTPSDGATVMNGETWSIGYGDGSSASGNVYQDTVVVGGVTATAQAVEAAQTVSSSFSSDTSNDGLLGLSWSSLNTVSPDQQKTFYDNVQSSLADPVFAAILKHDAPGSYDFGFIDSSKYTGNITYTPADNSQGYWGFTVDSYTVGTTVTSTALSGIADTGTSLLLLDDTTCGNYYAQVSGAINDSSQGGWVYDCSTSLPDFSVSINGYTATVPGSYLTYDQQSSGQCYGGIQSSTAIGFNIFGDVFLKSQYVVFDGPNVQLGFASQA
ncbi:aspartic proteinase complexed with Pepstatin [Talaromyces proteolyticus]|uniref:Aspartic proteinase complexed with Pepstatin n=1 Tax=Talaromyces proteolyticus TaxID=1131652 RepID=A0AAD4L366_9EURO|nr:aspartic proteinase complexed with Pepstatin [Talaromyces proteolyticus]KAH8702374.1 aspartic proteinase complexed with Pepstatin [Talaromyces proteolyticus]